MVQDSVSASDWIRQVDAIREATSPPQFGMNVEMPPDFKDYPKQIELCECCGDVSAHAVPMDGRPFYCSKRGCHNERKRFSMAKARAS